MPMFRTTNIYGSPMAAQIIPSTIWLLKCHYRFINSKQWWNYRFH
jgi:hypothetical protein